MISRRVDAGLVVGAVALAPLWPAAQSPAGPNETLHAPMEWSQERPLELGDFVAQPDAASKAAALTSYEIQTRSGCDSTGPSYHVAVRFLPAQSWIKPRQRTPRVLAHEQGHFDLAEVTARRLRAKLASLGLSCAEGKAEFAKAVAEVNVMDADRQRSYDMQTMYGTDSAAQRRWEAQIKSWIRDAAGPARAQPSPPQTQMHRRGR